MVDHHILEQFVTFYRTGTLRETAEKMNISQPTLTRNMQKLEEEFEVPLFNRTKNRISLNETGLLAAEDAEMLLKQTENMLLFQDIGFWHDLVVEKMPDSRFLVQTERYTFMELIENSTMPVFTTDYLSDSFPCSPPATDRVTVPITDPEFHVSYYLACRRENRSRLKSLNYFPAQPCLSSPQRPFP